MNITITLPGTSPHGGIRVIIEWANWLASHHEVTVLCSGRKPTWINVDPRIVTGSVMVMFTKAPG